MSDQDKQGWTVHQWRDGAGNLTSSYEIHEGDKLIVADLLKDECDAIANAHNAALAAERENVKKLGEQYKAEIHLRIDLEQQLAAERKQDYDWGK